MNFNILIMIYAFMLLDIIDKSEDLKKIIYAVKRNLLSLFKFILLGFCVQYIYGALVYIYFTRDWV